MGEWSLTLDSDRSGRFEAGDGRARVVTHADLRGALPSVPPGQVREEADVVVAFLRRAAEMERPAYIRRGMPLHMSVRRNAAGELASEPLDINEDQLRSAFMAIRPFVLKKELSYLLRVYGACEAHGLSRSPAGAPGLAKAARLAQ